MSDINPKLPDRFSLQPTSDPATQLPSGQPQQDIVPGSGPAYGYHPEAAQYATHPHHPQTVQADPQKPGRSIGRTILQILGWTALFSAVMIMLVVGSGLWTARTIARDVLNPNTRTTVITKGPVVASIKQVNKQIMVEHNNMVYVDYREAPEGWLQVLPIEQSFVVILKGQVPAGFDLGGLSEEDVWISEDGGKVRLTLPPPVIFEENVAVDFSESRVIAEGDSCPNFICDTDLNALQETVLPQGRPLLVESSQESGILEQTAQLGIAYYESLLRALGFEDVQVIVRGESE